MSERQEFEAGKEARRGVLHDAGHETASTDRMEALVRYLKGAGQGKSTGTGRAKPLSDAEIRTQAVNRVIDAGGEVTAAIVAAGSLLLRGRIGCRSEIALLERTLSQIPGVTRLDMRLEYDIDDM
jgi:hypothetical protein